MSLLAGQTRSRPESRQLRPRKFAGVGRTAVRRSCAGGRAREVDPARLDLRVLRAWGPSRRADGASAADPDRLEVDADVVEGRRHDTARLAEQAEEDVLGAEVVVVESLRLFEGVLEEALRAVRERQRLHVAGGRPGLHVRLDLRAQGCEVDVESLEHRAPLPFFSSARASSTCSGAMWSCPRRSAFSRARAMTDRAWSENRSNIGVLPEAVRAGPGSRCRGGAPPRSPHGIRRWRGAAGRTAGAPEPECRSQPHD